jgi:Nodulation protein S (NodS)
LILSARLLAVTLFGSLLIAAQDGTAPRRVSWDALAPVHARLQVAGLSSSAFSAFLERIHTTNLQRVAEGDLDHLIFYLLQSTKLSGAQSEPALSAKELVEGLPEAERRTFLAKGELDLGRVPGNVRSRVAALLRAVDNPTSDQRLVYFRDLVATSFPDVRQRQDGVLREYLRAMRFLYEKEFVAQRSSQPAGAIADLYRTRGLSTDTAIEAGYLVYQGLGVVRSLHSDTRVRRVLIIGPGLDLAPRTGFLESGPPESYQPWAVIDALLGLGAARADSLVVVAGDINPRVVAHLQQAARTPPVLALVSGIADSQTVSLTADYREYFAGLGGSIGSDRAAVTVNRGHLQKTVKVRAGLGRILRAETLDIVTERLTGDPFDLIVATNVLPYFDDVQLTLALANVSSMLAPGGTFLHNESRPLLRDVAAALGLPVEQSRHAVIANVRGAPAPLFDSVWVHRRK